VNACKERLRSAALAAILGGTCVGCASKSIDVSTAVLANLAKHCVQAHSEEGWLEDSFFDQTHIRFSFLTHPEMPFWSLRFADYTVLRVDGGRSVHGCYSDRTTLLPARIWHGRGGPDYERRSVADVDWDPDSYSDEEWEEFTLGEGTIAIDDKSPQDLGLGSVPLPR
jgi:hypothetical protein